MKEYRINRKSRIFIYVTSALLTALFLPVVLSPVFSFGDSFVPHENYFFIGPLSAIIILVFSYAFIETVTGKLILHENKIVATNILRTKQLELSDIQGYRSGPGGIKVIATHSIFKNIIVSDYLEDHQEKKLADKELPQS